MPRPSRVALGVLCLAATAVAGDARVRQDRGHDRERIVVRDDGRDRVLDGGVVVEAVDGGILLELPDQRYEVVPPAAIVSRTPSPDEAGDGTPRDVGQRILADLPAGFDLLTTRHYVVCFDTSRDYARWSAALFERLHEAFVNFWTKAGLDVAEPARPLVIVIFADRGAYETHAARDLGPAAGRVVGYYNLITNRVTTYDLTGTDAVAEAAGGGRGATTAEIMSSPAAAGLVSTLVHEATHQMAFNCGMHRRLAPVPLWVSEGIATYFEPPDLASDRGWRGIGTVNRPRLDHFLATHRPGDLAAIVAADERFRGADAPLDAYAAAWALTRHLLDTRRREFVGYLRVQAARQPLAADSPESRLADFVAAFGTTPADLEADVVRTMARLASRPRR